MTENMKILRITVIIHVAVGVHTIKIMLEALGNVCAEENLTMFLVRIGRQT